MDSDVGTVFKYFITRDEVLMGRDKEFPLSANLEKNLNKLLIAINKLREKYGKPMAVSSGYRPGHYNVEAHGAKNSTHLVCEACDFYDTGGLLDKFCTENQPLLAELGLYLEHPESTPGWCHLDIRTREHRIFRP